MMKGVRRNYDGFLDLNSLPVEMNPEWGKDKYSFTYNDQKYYFKKGRREDEGYRELIAEAFAEIYELDHAYYDLATLNGMNGSLSKCFYDKDETFTEMFFVIKDNFKCKFPEELHNLKSIKKVLETYIKDERRLGEECNKFFYHFIYDVCIANGDRNVMNDGLICNNGEYRLSPLFDNAEMGSDTAISHIYGVGVDENDIMFTRNKPANYLRKFLDMYGNEYGSVLKDYINYMTDEHIEMAFKMAEDKIKAPIDIRTKCYLFGKLTFNRDVITRTLNEYYEGVKEFKK